MKKGKRSEKTDRKNGLRRNPRIHTYKDGPRAATLAELKAIKVIHHKNPRRV